MEEDKFSTKTTDTSTCTNEVLKQFLKQALKKPDGITILIATKNDPHRILSGEIQDVCINTAWIAFTVKGTTYRTETASDRKKFEEWFTSQKPAPFSLKKEYEGLFGPPNVTFIKTNGIKII